MNLLLAGRAVSQVFDGVKPLGDTGLVLRGIEAPTEIGFLSFHEAMRCVSLGVELQSSVQSLNHGSSFGLAFK